MANNKYKPSDQWFRQADYDLETAEAMFEVGRYIYAVFMCHLSIEKALKGLYAKRFKKDPPKIHDLNYLAEKIELDIDQELQDFIDKLNNLSVPTRYPDELDRILKDYKQDATKAVLNNSKELLLCLKQKL